MKKVILVGFAAVVFSYLTQTTHPAWAAHATQTELEQLQSLLNYGKSRFSEDDQRQLKEHTLSDQRKQFLRGHLFLEAAWFSDLFQMTMKYRFNTNVDALVLVAKMCAVLKHFYLLYGDAERHNILLQIHQQVAVFGAVRELLPAEGPSPYQGIAKLPNHRLYQIDAVKFLGQLQLYLESEFQTPIDVQCRYHLIEAIKQIKLALGHYAYNLGDFNRADQLYLSVISDMVDRQWDRFKFDRLDDFVMQTHFNLSAMKKNPGKKARFSAIRRAGSGNA